jgi:hypothetical protein
LATKRNAGDDVARGKQERRQDQFLHRMSVGTGRVEDRDPAARHLGDGDVVGAGARACDRANALRDRHLVQVARAHEDPFRMLDGVAYGVARRRKALQAGGRDRAQGEDAISRHALWHSGARRAATARVIMIESRAQRP